MRKISHGKILILKYRYSFTIVVKVYVHRIYFVNIFSEISNFKLENVFVKHYAPNHMPDPKGELSLKENNSELHYGIRLKVNQFIYILVCNYMPNIRILA